MELWRRSALLVFGVKGESAVKVDTDKIFREGGAIPQITFDILKSITDKNSSQISVYNLNTPSRDVINRAESEEDIYVELHAGYGGENSLVFKGEVRIAQNVWNGTDYITSFEAYDGKKASKKKYSKSHAPGSKYKDIIKDILKGVGDTIDGIVLDVKESTTENGLTLIGATADVVKKVINMVPDQNLEFTIQDNVAIVRPANLSSNPTEVPVISNSTGLIGSPKTVRKGVEFKCLIQAGLLPSRSIKLVTLGTDLDGIYILQKVKMSGQTRDGDWTATCVAIKDDRFIQV